MVEVSNYALSFSKHIFEGVCVWGEIERERMFNLEWSWILYFHNFSFPKDTVLTAGKLGHSEPVLTRALLHLDWSSWKDWLTGTSIPTAEYRYKSQAIVIVPCCEIGLTLFLKVEEPNPVWDSSNSLRISAFLSQEKVYETIGYLNSDNTQTSVLLLYLHVR